MRFKEKEQKKAVVTEKDDATSTKSTQAEENTDEESGDDSSQLKKLVMGLTDQVKSLKIQNEHMMDDDYKKKNQNKKRAKTINKIGALKLLLTNLKSELKDDETDGDLSVIKNQLDKVEAK
jgi:Rps23 Pro-64 3,4-dihydroxylase Tpa1-like proline 4-hydroxylase